MCLAIPGKVIDIDTTSEPLIARVNCNGIIKEVCIACVADVAIDDYLIVHAGFAISKLDQEEAQKTLELFAEIDMANEELSI